MDRGEREPTRLPRNRGKNSVTKRWDNVVLNTRLVLGVSWIIYQSIILLHPVHPMTQRFSHVVLALAVLMLGRPLKPETEPLGTRSRNGLNIGLFICLLSVTVYFLFSIERLSTRMETVDPIYTADVIISLVLILLVMEAVRRIIGWSLVAVIVVFLSFGFVGRLIPSWTQWSWLPELFKFSGFSLSEAVETFVLTPNGLLGVTTATSVNFVFYFVLFGAVYSAIGGGRLFIDLGLKAAGRSTNGTAKAAVVASSLMGSISGSAVANVATTGLFTIPLMRRTGHSANFAGAVEAIASTGGQLMPPVMGVAAFVMAEFLQEPYASIALAGLIPALAFYLALFLAVDLRARKADPVNFVNSSEEPPQSIRRRLHLLAPPVLLVSLLILGWSASIAAVGATILCIVTSGVWSALRKPWREWRQVILRGTLQAAEVAVPIAAIGLIIEVAVQSNLALKFSIVLLEISGTTILGAMIWIVLGCLVMGLGLPTVAAYIIGAILFVPTLKDLGIHQVSAHFFVMYYCVLSMVTPPVALASYTAAGLAGGNRLFTSLIAFRLGLVGFVIPFAFAFNPALVAQGSWISILIGAAVLFLGTTVWVVALEGYWLRSLRKLERAILAIIALSLLIAPVIVRAVVDSTGLATGTAQGLVWTTLAVLLAASASSILLSSPKTPDT